MGTFKYIFILSMALAILSVPCGVLSAKKVVPIMMTISSPAFKDMAEIPLKYTGYGKSVVPPLIITGTPANTKSFAIITEDPDAMMGTFDHWVIFNIPGSIREIKEATYPEGSVRGRNSAGSTSYYGPHPPAGKPHRYIFTFYALDIMLPLKEGAGKHDVMKAMEGHILEKAKLTGLFQKK